MTRHLNIGWLVILGLLTTSQSALAADSASDNYLKMVVKLLGNKDNDFRAAGLDQVRDASSGAAATKEFAEQLPKLDAAGQAALLAALADRGDKAARPAVLEVLNKSQDESVRAAALLSLGNLGETSDLPLLVQALGSRSAAEQTAARRALSVVRDESVSKTLVAEAQAATAGVKSALIEVLATRRAAGSLPMLVGAALDDNQQVRTAAMNALGQFGGSGEIGAMLAGVLKASKGGERDNAEKSVALVCSRIEPENARAEALIRALDAVAPENRDDLLSVVGRVGGRKLIDFVASIATSSDPVRRKIGIDALGKWPDAAVADKLLDIANKTKDQAERAQAFQAYVKIGATRDKRNDQQRLDRMKQALKAARSPEEKTLVINRARTAYTVETLRFVLPFVDDPAFAQVACETIVELAHHREIRDPNKAEFDKALDKVIETSKNAEVVERARRYQKGETWDRKAKS